MRGSVLLEPVERMPPATVTTPMPSGESVKLTRSAKLWTAETGVCTIVGTDAGEVIHGTPGADRIADWISPIGGWLLMSEAGNRLRRRPRIGLAFEPTASHSTAMRPMPKRSHLSQQMPCKYSVRVSMKDCFA